MNRVSISYRTRTSQDLARSLRRILLQSMRRMKLSAADVSVLLTSDVEIERMNRKYRKMNRPTDVLSFSQDAPAKRGRRLLLGDIVISLPTARRQAKKAGHSLEAECSLLGVHGLLHLLGHDHADRAEAAAMFSLQNRILGKVYRHV